MNLSNPLKKNRVFSYQHILAISVITLMAFPTITWASWQNWFADKTIEATDKEIVVLLHGLGRTPSAMWMLANRLEDAGYVVVRLGYHSLADSPSAILEDITGQIEKCCLEKSPRLHFVGHSLGGLVIRAYLERSRPENLGHAVLIGSPSGGTEIVDNLESYRWFQWLGPTSLALGTDNTFFPDSKTPADYSLGVIAGFSKTISKANDELLPGDDDGLVAVHSTHIEGMADFALVESGHAGLRYNREVADLVIAFLNNGQFRHEGQDPAK